MVESVVLLEVHERSSRLAACDENGFKASSLLSMRVGVVRTKYRKRVKLACSTFALSLSLSSICRISLGVRNLSFTNAVNSS